MTTQISFNRLMMVTLLMLASLVVFLFTAQNARAAFYLITYTLDPILLYDPIMPDGTIVPGWWFYTAKITREATTHRVYHIEAALLSANMEGGLNPDGTIVPTLGPEAGSEWH